MAHLLKERAAVVAKVCGMLKFTTSTICLGDTMDGFKALAPIGRIFGLLPNST